MANSADAVTDTLGAVSDPVRRMVLYSLAEHETPVTFNRAARVAAWHTDCVPRRSWNECSVSSWGVPGG